MWQSLERFHPVLSRRKTLCACGVVVFGCILVSIQTVSAQTAQAAQNPDQWSCRAQMFKVTAYYSPLLWQDLYYKPTYEEEIRLNGRWTNWASWAPVFNGMIAAPKSYAFGTRIRFPWWGVWQVEDRWQAIVHKWERSQPHDRVDIWVWKWEEWLRRALSFWVQYIEGFVCEGDTAGAVWFDFDALPYYEDFLNTTLRSVSLQPWRRDLFVKSLQGYLSALWFIDESGQTGEYSRATKAAVCMFQQKHLWLSPSHEACWWFWPQTRRTMKDLVTKKWIQLWSSLTLSKEGERYTQWANETSWVEWKQWGLTIVDASEDALEDASDKTSDSKKPFWSRLSAMPPYSFDKPFIKGTRDREVYILQKKLAWLGYYEQWAFTWVYDSATIAAVYKFQRAQGILRWTEPLAVRWWFGPSTRKTINRL